MKLNRHKFVTYCFVPAWKTCGAALFCVLAFGAFAQGTESNIWTGGGSDINWSTPGNWNGGAPIAGSDVFFTPAGASGGAFAAGGGTANNQVDANFTLDSLWSAPTNAWQVTEIPAGNTLTITGSMPITLVSLGTDHYAMWVGSLINQSMSHTFQGGGTLAVNSPAAMVMVRNSYNSFISSYPTLDLSALNTFTANVIGICVGGEGTTDASFSDRPIGILYLAQTNIITSTNTVMLRPASLPGLILDVGDSIVDTGAPSYVYLGNTNAFLGAVGIAVGWRRGQGNLSFNPSSVNGVAYFRNLAGTGTQSYWGIGDNFTGNTGFTSSGTVDFTGGMVDAMVDQMYVGRSGTSTSSGADGTGTLLIGNGIINVNSLFIGTQRTGNNVGWGNGTVTTSGGPSVTNLVVNNNLSLGSVISGGGVASTAGTLNINSCVVVTGNLVAGGAPKTTVNLYSGSLTVGGTLGQSTSAINNLNLSGGTLNLSLGSAGNPVNPVCNASNLSVGAITLNLTGSGITPGVIPVMQYYTSGSFSGITYGTLPSKVYGYYSNSATTLYLVVTNVDAPKWSGSVNGNWDTTTANWVGQLSGAPTTYQQAVSPADSVLFDDTATGTTTVNLTTNFSPSAITVNNSTKVYTFGGTGWISGATGLNKEGSAMLILDNTGSNSFTGPVSIAGGDFQLAGGSNCLPTNSTVTLSDAAGVNLDLNGQNQQLKGLVGGGTSGGNVTLGTGTLTLAGNGSEFDGIISGPGNVALTSGTQIFGGANLYGGSTVIYGGTLVVANSTGSGIGSGNLLIAGGTLQIGNGSASGSIAQTIITNNGTLALDRADDLVFSTQVTGTGALSKLSTDTVTLSGINTYTGSTTISDGALSITSPASLGSAGGAVNISSSQLARLELSGDITLANPLTLSSKSGSFNAPPHIENLSGTNIVAGPINGAGGGTDWSFQSDAGDLIVTGNFTNTAASVSQDVDLRGAASGEWRGDIANGSSPSFVVALNKLDGGTWILGGTNTYVGPTSVEGGTLVVNGLILGSSGVNITFGTLAGSGVITCPVTAGFPGTIWPGNAAIGTMTINNTLTLTSASTCIFDVNQFASSEIRGLTSVNYGGGTLEVIADASLSANAVFKLFDATNYNSAFGGFDLPPLNPPLTWDTSFLSVDGTLRITGGPAISSYGFSGAGDFQISGTGTDGSTYRILATTNLSLPLASWTQVGSGTFTGGAFTFSDTNAIYRQQFFQVVSP